MPQETELVPNPQKIINTQDRRELIIHKIQQQGLWNINKTKLAQELHVNRATITQDFKAIFTLLDKEDLAETRISLKTAYKKIVQELHRAMDESPDAYKKVKIAEVLANAMEKYTNMLEAWAIKQKVPDRVESSNMNLNINLDVIKFKNLLKEYENSEKKEEVTINTPPTQPP